MTNDFTVVRVGRHSRSTALDPHDLHDRIVDNCHTSRGG